MAANAVNRNQNEANAAMNPTLMASFEMKYKFIEILTAVLSLILVLTATSMIRI